jgi:RNA-directed DNA polymerase
MPEPEELTPPRAGEPAPGSAPKRTPARTALRKADGSPLLTAGDVAEFLGAGPSKLNYLLYKAPEDVRYRASEIPKKTGGVRQLYAPHPDLKAWQRTALKALTEFYEPHPDAHGFLKGRSIVSNAAIHIGQPLVLNIDLKDFFPSVHFGRVRGLFMSPPFEMGASAATVMAQLVTFKNQLPQGAPTSPILSGMAAAELDRRLSRLARRSRLKYSRYADDITLSGAQGSLPASLLAFERDANGKQTPIIGPQLAQEIIRAGFTVNPAKVRVQTRHQRQSVTGLTVNAKTNVARERVRRLRAMIHAWRKFGLEAAAAEHVAHYVRGAAGPIKTPARHFRAALSGELAFLKMVRGGADPAYLRFCADIAGLDPKPSKAIRRAAFGAADFDVFISHASEDKDAVARPIFEALEAIGVSVFFDENHINWGENYTAKINTALGAAKYVLAVITSTSVAKDWPVLEVNAALALEASGKKAVLPLVVGKPDLTKLPLLATKDVMFWDGDAARVARRLKETITGAQMGAARRGATAMPSIDPDTDDARASPSPVAKPKGGLFGWLGLGKKKP